MYEYLDVFSLTCLISGVRVGRQAIVTCSVSMEMPGIRGETYPDHDFDASPDYHHCLIIIAPIFDIHNPHDGAKCREDAQTENAYQRDLPLRADLQAVEDGHRQEHDDKIVRDGEASENVEGWIVRETVSRIITFPEFSNGEAL